MGFGSRYSNRTIFRTSNALYREDLKKRAIKYFRYYETPRLKELTPSEQDEIEVVGHTWSLGDRYYKLAHKYYGDAEAWWIIAWYNAKPTEGHLRIGETVNIPMPLWKVRSAYGI